MCNLWASCEDNVESEDWRSCYSFLKSGTLAYLCLGPNETIQAVLLNSFPFNQFSTIDFTWQDGMNNGSMAAWLAKKSNSQSWIDTDCIK